MRPRSSLLEESLPDVLLYQLQTLTQLQRRADSLRGDLALLKMQLSREVLDAGSRDHLDIDPVGDESILIADDHLIVRSIAQEILEAFGYHVILANGTLSDFTAQAPIDLILLDLPILDAIHLTRVRVAKQAAARLVVCTPLPEGPARMQLLAHGADGFVSKPFHPLTLARSIRRVLDAPQAPCTHG